jgi:hypothetical protein
MKYTFFFLMLILLSCSKKEEASEISTKNNVLIDKETNELADIVDDNVLDNQMTTNKNNLTSYDTIIPGKILLQDFFDHPFVDKNIVMPNYNGYNSFDELFSHLGTPINEFPLKSRYSDYEGNYELEFEYTYYNVCTLYVQSKDVIYTTLIWININDDILYNHDIKKNDKPDKIVELFGMANSIFNIQNNRVEYNYYLPDNWNQINFQFLNEELTAIIFHLMD